MSKYHSSAKYEFRQNLKPRIAPLTAAVSGALAAGTLQAATITVDSLDGGHVNDKCTLRSALYSATLNSATSNCVAGEVGMDTIVFDSSLSGTIELVDGGVYMDMPSSLRVGESVRVDGDDRITIQGDGSGPVFYSKYEGVDAGDRRTGTLELSGLTITGGSGAYGGGVFSRGRNLILNSVEVVGNSSASGGGGIWHAPFAGTGTLHILGSHISGNASFGPGGGVGMSISYGDYYAPALLVENSYFGSNDALGPGGGLHFSSSDYSGMEIRNTGFFDNESKYGGGGVHADMGYAAVLLESNQFFGNYTSGSGGGLYLAEDRADFHRARIFLTNNSFRNNEAGQRGGGAHLHVESGSYAGGNDPRKWIDVVESDFDFNQAAEGGGALSIITTDEVPVTLMNTYFGFNEITGGAYYTLGGGAVFARVTDATLAVLGSEFFRNYTDAGAGGGLRAHIIRGAFYASDILVHGNESRSSSMAANGGGMLIASYNQAKVGIEHAVFYENSTVGGCGGALNVQTQFQTQVEIGHSIFRSNDSGRCGGALLVRSTAGGPASVAQVKYSEFSYNSSVGNGGAIFSQFDDGGRLILSNSTLSANRSVSSSGSALHVFFGDLELKYSTVANNEWTSASSITGSALGFSSSGNCSVTASLFGGNKNADGSLTDIGSSGSDCKVSRSLLEGATASSFDDQGNNLLDVDPMIGPLQYNNSFNNHTHTHVLLAGSPAIDAAGVGGLGTPDHDQRGPGFARQAGPGIDMGAYEVQTAVPGQIFQDRFEQ